MENIKFCLEIPNTDSNKCEHGTRKTYCKICKGGAICQHNNVRYSCKECKGSSLCLHLHLCTFKTPTFTCATNNSLIFVFYLTFS